MTKLHLDVGCCDGIWMLQQAMKNVDDMYVGLDHSLRAVADSPRGVYNLLKHTCLGTAHDVAYREENNISFDPYSITITEDMLNDPFRRSLGSDPIGSPHLGYVDYNKILEEDLRRIANHPRGKRMLKYKVRDTFIRFLPDDPLTINFPGMPDATVEELIFSDPSPEFTKYYKPYTDRISAVLGDARHLPFADNNFDEVTVLNFGYDKYSIPPPEERFNSLFNETKRVVKAGSNIIISPVPYFMREEYPRGIIVNKIG